MQYHAILDRIRAETGMQDDEDARRLAQAVVTALGERVTPGLAGNVASQLPPELQGG